jgi:hypothetical protein
VSRTAELDVTAEVAPGQSLVAKLAVVEWTTAMERALYLCDEEGFALVEVPVGIHAPGFAFTAYLKSKFFRELKEQNLIETELAPGREALLESAKRKLKEYFRTREAELAQDAVERWRSEDIYPYAGTPSNTVEVVERQVFESCAVTLAEHLPDFDRTDIKQKRLTFRLLKQAVEENPESLQTILSEVLGLPKEKQDELADLLKQTSLSAILNASKVVADRPTQIVDAKVLQQIEDYAFAVARDERFRDTDTRWRFVAISNDISENVRRKASQRNKPVGLVHDDDNQPLTIWVHTWGQLLERARGRLEFFRKELNYNADRDSAQAHLRKVYEKYLPKPKAKEDAGS